MLTVHGSIFALRLDLELSYLTGSARLNYLSLHSCAIACASGSLVFYCRGTFRGELRHLEKRAMSHYACPTARSKTLPVEAR